MTEKKKFPRNFLKWILTLGRMKWTTYLSGHVTTTIILRVLFAKSTTAMFTLSNIHPLCVQSDKNKVKKNNKKKSLKPQK